MPPERSIPAELAHRVTAVEQATLAGIDQWFHRLDRADAVTDHKRYGVAPSGQLIAETSTLNVFGDRVDYVSSGFSWIDEAFYDGGRRRSGGTRWVANRRRSGCGGRCGRTGTTILPRSPVDQAHGVDRQEMTPFRMWTSVDDGAAWKPVQVRRDGAARYTAPVPQPPTGQAVSLRIAVRTSGGSGFEQTIVRANAAR